MSVSFHIHTGVIPPEDVCPICREGLNNVEEENPVVSHTGDNGDKHPLHKNCIELWLQTSVNQRMGVTPGCPLCQAPVERSETVSWEEIIFRPRRERHQPDALNEGKIEAKDRMQIELTLLTIIMSALATIEGTGFGSVSMLGATLGGVIAVKNTWNALQELMEERGIERISDVTARTISDTAKKIANAAKIITPANVVTGIAAVGTTLFTFSLNEGIQIGAVAQLAAIATIGGAIIGARVTGIALASFGAVGRQLGII